MGQSVRSSRAAFSPQSTPSPVCCLKDLWLVQLEGKKLGTKRTATLVCYLKPSRAPAIFRDIPRTVEKQSVFIKKGAPEMQLESPADLALFTENTKQCTQPLRDPEGGIFPSIQNLLAMKALQKLGGLFFPPTSISLTKWCRNKASGSLWTGWVRANGLSNWLGVHVRNSFWTN